MPVKTKTIRKNVILEKKDLEIIKRICVEKGLGQRGHSAAIRLALREFDSSQNADPQTISIQGAS